MPRMAQDFLPAAGDIARWQPASGPGVRIDSGVESGQTVSPFYDPMIAKVIAHGDSREIARRRLIRALAETAAFGLTTNKRFLIDCLEKESSPRAEATTGFPRRAGQRRTIWRRPGRISPSRPPPPAEILAAGTTPFSDSLKFRPKLADWSSEGPRKPACRPDARRRTAYRPVDLAVRFARPTVREDGESESVQVVSLEEGRAIFAVGGAQRHLLFHAEGDILHLSEAGRDYRFDLDRSAASLHDEQSGGRVVAPMHGKILEIAVEPGDTVARGDRLLVIEAMKMQHDIVAPAAGAIAGVLQQAGIQVAAGDPLVDIAVAEQG